MKPGFRSACVVVAAMGGCRSLAQADVQTADDASSAGADGASASSGASAQTGTGGSADGVVDDGAVDDGAVDDGAVDDGGSWTAGADSGPTSTDDGGVEPGCGNGVREAGEACDDGNEDESDACTTRCMPPSCDDGITSGDESDVDCGGAACQACGMGADCGATPDCGQDLVCAERTGQCQLPASCLHHLELDASATTGFYAIDPDGDGTTFQVYCNMVEDGGGWTRISSENFATVDEGWSHATSTDCGPITGILGGYNVLDVGEELVREYDLLGVPHTEAWLRLNYVFIDSWDDEVAYAQLDGVQVISEPHSAANIDGNLCGGGYDDGNAILHGVTGHSQPTVEVVVGATLNQSGDDESFGLDSIRVFVR